MLWSTYMQGGYSWAAIWKATVLINTIADVFMGIGAAYGTWTAVYIKALQT